MRLVFLIALAMIAFAANSVLNRLALAETSMSAIDFALYRVAFGTLILFVILAGRRGLKQGHFSWTSTMGLAAYMLGFSIAYQSIGAGLGALILFGVVQLTMFGGAMALGERPKASAYIGAGLGLSGLFFVLWPTDSGFEFTSTSIIAMIVAGVGWGVFSLAGRIAGSPLAMTFRAFLISLPGVFFLAVWQGLSAPNPTGLAYAALSGAIMSGLGYAIWYYVLPQIQATTAAVAQLTVPLIAMIGAVFFLDETVGWKFIIGSVLVLSGVLLQILMPEKEV